MIDIDTTRQAYEQQIARAEAELKVLSSELQQFQLRELAINAELQTLTDRKEARIQLLQTARSTLANTQAAQSLAKAQRKMREGQLTHDTDTTALKEASQHVGTAENALKEIEAKGEREEGEDRARAYSLSTELEAVKDRLAEIKSEQHAYLEGKSQAHIAIGQLKYHQITSMIRDVEERIAARDRDNAQDQQALLDLRANGINELADWSALQSQLRLSMPYENATTRVLHQGLTLIDSLLRDAQDIDDVLNVPSLQNSFFPWLEVFALTRDELYRYEHIKGKPNLLRNRRDNIATILQEYIAAKRCS